MTDRPSVVECRLVLLFAGCTYTQTFSKDKKAALIEAIDAAWMQRYVDPDQRTNDILVLGEDKTISIAKLDGTRLVGWWIEDITPAPPPSTSADDEYKRLMSEYLRESIRFFKRQDDDGDGWKRGG
jgi:hypothetical protein